MPVLRKSAKLGAGFPDFFGFGFYSRRGEAAASLMKIKTKKQYAKRREEVAEES